MCVYRVTEPGMVVPDPHQLFISMLYCVSHDHTVLLDFLTSPETCFLIYFLKYIKLVQSEWQRFTAGHKLYRQSEATNHQDTQATSTGELLSSGKTMKSQSETSSGELLSGNETMNTLLKSCALVSYSDSSDDEENNVTMEKLTSNIGEMDLTNSTNIDLSKSTEELSNQMVEDTKGGIGTQECSSTSELEAKCYNSEQVLSHDNSEIENHLELDQTMSVLIRLRMSIERLDKHDMFPYNAKPLLRHLTRCEDLYEQ